MSRFRLRHEGSEFAIPESGSFTIGRGSDCELSLDDALISRRHVTVEVRGGELWLVDLESRNGVHVNGERVDRERRLVHEDRVTLGAHTILVIDEDTATLRCSACGAAAPREAIRCPACNAKLSPQRGREGSSRVDTRKTLAGIPIHSADTVSSTESEDEPTLMSSLLGGLASKAIALGSYEEAERMFGRVLDDFLARARKGQTIHPITLAESTTFALKLAEGLKKPSWIDWVFEIHTVTQTLMSAPDVERLHELIRRVKYTNAGVIRRYVEQLTQPKAELSPAQRFQIQRIEGLLRVVVA